MRIFRRMLHVCQVYSSRSVELYLHYNEIQRLTHESAHHVQAGVYVPVPMMTRAMRAVAAAQLELGHQSRACKAEGLSSLAPLTT